MDASSSTSSSDLSLQTRWRPWAAVAAVAICAVIELLVLRPNRLLLSDPLTAVIAEKRNALQRGGDARFAIFGDSRFFHLPPAQLAPEGAGAGLNLSWAWCGFEAYDVMLTALLKSHPHVKTVYVPGSPELIAYSPANVLAAENGDYRERLFQAAPFTALLKSLSRRNQWGLLGHQVERAFMPPSYVYGPELRRRGAAILKGQQPNAAGLDRQRLLQDYRDDYAFAYGADAVVSAEQTLAIEPVAGPFRVYRNRRAGKAFESFLARADQANLSVVMLPIPVATPLYDLYQQRGILTAYQQQLDMWQAQHPHFKLAGNAVLSYPVEQFLDPGHLNLTGHQRHIAECRELLSR